MRLALLLLLLLSLLLVGSCNQGGTGNTLELYNKGKVAYNKKQLAKAESFFKQAMDNDPDFSNAALMLSKIYYFRKDFNKALSCQEQILKDKPEHIGALYWKARTIIASKKAGEDDQAVKSLKKILVINRNHLKARSLLALIYEKNGKFNEALREYKEILKEEETIISARANLSLLYHRIGFKDKATKEISRALAISKINGTNIKVITKIKEKVEK